MIIKGYITVYRKHITQEKAMYCITHKGKQIMDEYYSILEGKNLKTVLIEIQRIARENGRMKSLEPLIKAAVDQNYDPKSQLRPSL